MKWVKWVISPAMVLGILLLASCGQNKVETTMESEVASFHAINQDGITITNSDLLGEWWVADFIFTNCTSVCPPMTRNMIKLQNKMADENVKANLISFSVDPENDTPEVLKQYANDHGAKLNNWSFLTGYDFETIQELSIGSFKSDVMAPTEGDDQVGHGVRFFLVNPEGVVVHSYIGTEADAMDQLVEDLKILTK